MNPIAYLASPRLAATVVALLIALPNLACATTIRIYDTQSSSFIQYQDFVNALPGRANIIMGEMHYTKRVQEAEGRIVRDLASAHPNETPSLAWEFVNFVDQPATDRSFTRFVSREIDGSTLMKELKVGGKAEMYLPMMEAAREVGAHLYGVNVARAEKKKVIEKGFSALPPHLKPRDLSPGSEGYRRRFEEAMSKHVPADKIEGYYRAQYYTDAVMAWQFSEKLPRGLRFLVAGSFHTDFNDATTDRIKRLTGERTITIKLVDESKVSSKDLKEIIAGDATDGAYSDYLYLIN